MIAGKGKMASETKSTRKLAIKCAEDRSFAGILECWPEESGGPYSSSVLDVAVAIRAGRIMVAELREGNDLNKARVVGWLQWDDRFIPGSLYLRKVMVHKDYRRKGILGLLLARAVEFASKASFSQIVGDLGPDSLLSEAAARKFGFRPIGKVTGLAGERYVTTFWRLKPKG